MTTFNFTFTEEQLAKIIPINTQVHDWFTALSNNLPNYQINTIARVCAFLAQCAHESGEFTALHENLNYRASSLVATWPKRFTDDTAPLYEHNPVKIANLVYANRMGNGDEESGEGYKYRGRGLMQITGKYNYTKCSHEVFNDDRLVHTPDLLETDKDTAIKSACWFWNANVLNPLADDGDITAITQKINGGQLGIEDRKDRYNKAVIIIQGYLPT